MAPDRSPRRMPVSDAEIAALAPALRALLERWPAERLPATYDDVATALGLAAPLRIHRVTRALETLMQEDAAAGRPLVAALVVSRTGRREPAPGFFALATALGRLPPEPAAAAAAWRREFAAAVAACGQKRAGAAREAR